MSSTILVSNIGEKTSEKELKDFLSFCGKISTIKIESDGDKQKATVVFEKASAASTAKLLDGTSLGAQEIHVTAESSSTSTSQTAEHEDDPLSQENKPRTRVVAEYLAHGYKLGDSVLGKAIEYDNTHGISSRFFKGLTDLDKKTGASTKAADLDSKYAVTEKAQQTTQSVWSGLSSYYEKFTGTQTGSKIHAFYTDSEKQVRDIHNEAIRLAGLKDKYQTTDSEVKKAEVVPGTDGQKTHCTCGGADKVCGCKVGECTCNGCSKADSNVVL